jgi:hypothetical protein
MIDTDSLISHLTESARRPATAHLAVSQTVSHSRRYPATLAALQEERLVGLDCVNAVTTLLQRVRNAHPMRESFQAAEVQYDMLTAAPAAAENLGRLAADVHV